MKHCPTCNRDYDDDSLRFCLDDGEALVTNAGARMVPASTLVLNTPEESQATLSQAGPPDVPAPHHQPVLSRRADGGEGRLSAWEGSGPSHVPLIIGIVLGAGLLLILGGLGVSGLVFVRRAPMLFICFAGLIVAMARSKRLPKVSLLTALGLGLYLLQAFTYSAVLSWLPTLTQALQIHYTRTATIYTFASVMTSFAFAAVIILLVCAAFTGRNQTRETNNYGKQGS
jgi:hypothetical protein